MCFKVITPSKGCFIGVLLGDKPLSCLSLPSGDFVYYIGFEYLAYRSCNLWLVTEFCSWVETKEASGIRSLRQ